MKQSVRAVHVHIYGRTAGCKTWSDLCGEEHVSSAHSNTREVRVMLHIHCKHTQTHVPWHWPYRRCSLITSAVMWLLLLQDLILTGISTVMLPPAVISTSGRRHRSPWSSPCLILDNLRRASAITLGPLTSRLPPPLRYIRPSATYQHHLSRTSRALPSYLRLYTSNTSSNSRSWRPNTGGSSHSTGTSSWSSSW